MSPATLAAGVAVLSGVAAGGYFLVRLFAGELSGRERAGWSIACGVLALSGVSAGLMALHLAPGPKKFGAALVVLALLSWVVRRPGTTPSPVRRTEGASILPAVLSTLALLLVLLFAVEAARGGTSAAEGFAAWGVKAKTIFATGSIPGRLFHDPALAFADPSEPLLAPLTLAAAAAAMRGWNDHALALFSPLFALATVLVVSGFLARRVSRLSGAAAGLLVALCAPLYGPGNVGMPAIPLALGMALAATAFLDALERETIGACARLLAASLFVAATGREGTVFAVLLAAAFFARRLRGWPVPRAAALALLVPVALHALALRLLRGPVDGAAPGWSLLAPSRLAEAGLQILGVEAVSAALPLLALAALLLVTRPGIADPLLPVLALQVAVLAVVHASSGAPLWAAQIAFAHSALTLFPVVAVVAAARAFAGAGLDSRALGGGAERASAVTAAVPIGLLLLAVVGIPEALSAVLGPRRMGPLAVLDRPTFHASVEPILQERCQTCHRPGGIGPLSLMTYDDADSQSRTIRRQVVSGQMPPWKAREGCGVFANDPSLTAGEIATIVRWVDGGSPAGDPRDAPPPRTFPDGWELGTPDVILEVPEFTPDFSKGDIYQCFVIPTELDANNWVSAVEVKPGNRAMVHHALLYVEEGIDSRKFDDAAPGPGYPCFGGPRAPVTDSFGEWAPGMQPRRYPEGTARFLPRKSRIIAQVHYSALFGSVAPDRSQIGVYFAKEPISRRLLSNDVRADAPFTIPAGAVSHTLRGRLGPLESRAELVAILPHMHLLGKTMKVTARFPDGTEHCLVDVADWDLRWQRTYFYKTPVVLPAGTRLDLEATFDNSYANPQNPSEPLVDVHFGELTTDEMCMALLFWTVDGKNPGEKDAFFRGSVCAPPVETPSSR